MTLPTNRGRTPAWPSRDLVRAAHQQITREWWNDRRPDFDLFVSQFVISESSAGDPDAAGERLEALQDMAVLETTEEAVVLAEGLVRQVPLPPTAAVDALHIANAVLLHRIEQICRDGGYAAPVICTPEQLLED